MARRNIRKVLVFDVETSGLLPKKTEDVPIEKLPHILQLSYIVFETDGWKVSKVGNYYVNVEKHVEISQKITELTGITREMCNSGSSIVNVLKEFCDEYMQCDLIVAHNIYFDRNMIQLEISRNKEKLPSHYVENVFSRNFEKENFKTNYCTMYNGRNICNIKKVNDKGETYVKCPKLSELYEHLFEEPVHGNLHNSLVDTYVCLKCLVKMRFKFDMKDRGYDAIMSHNKYS